jgi:hypothetical protein
VQISLLPEAIFSLVLLMNGLTRSKEFTAVNALSFSDLGQARMSGANAMFSMLQHLGKAMASLRTV